jgi:hypothetical protein
LDQAYFSSDKVIPGPKASTFLRRESTFNVGTANTKSGFGRQSMEVEVVNSGEGQDSEEKPTEMKSESSTRYCGNLKEPRFHPSYLFRKTWNAVCNRLWRQERVFFKAPFLITVHESVDDKVHAFGFTYLLSNTNCEMNTLM